MAEVRAFLIGLLLFSGVIIGMSAFYGDLTDPSNLASYGLSSGEIANISPENLASRNVTIEITQKTAEIEEALKKETTGITAVDVAWGYINAALNAVTLPLTALFVFTNMISDTVTFLHLPAWIGGIALSIIAVIIIMTIMSAYLKWRI